MITIKLNTNQSYALIQLRFISYQIVLRNCPQLGQVNKQRGVSISWNKHGGVELAFGTQWWHCTAMCQTY